MKLVASNKKAYRDYEILEKIEAGIELKGSEVKSIRRGNVNLKDSFARIENLQVILYNTHISPYEEASYLNVDPYRLRKLLLHKNQINRLWQKVAQRGVSLIPLKIYFNDKGLVKIELALCRGRKLYDRREAIKRKEEELRLRKVIKIKRSK